MNTTKLIIIVLATALAGCATQPTEDSSAIVARTADWEAAMNAKDIDAMVNLYTDDARVMAPNTEMSRGSDAIRAEFGAMIEAGLKIELKTVEAAAFGDIGHKVGTYVLSGPDGSAVDRGKFVETWRRDGGTWRISNDIYNSDVPKSSGGQAVLVTHDVADAEHWLAAWRGENNRHDMFKKHGVAHAHTMQNPDSPEQTAVVLSVTDKSAFEAFLASDVVQRAAAEDGVIADTMRMYVERE